MHFRLHTIKGSSAPRSLTGKTLYPPGDQAPKLCHHPIGLANARRLAYLPLVSLHQKLAFNLNAQDASIDECLRTIPGRPRMFGWPFVKAHARLRTPMLDCRGCVRFGLEPVTANPLHREPIYV